MTASFIPGPSAVFCRMRTATGGSPAPTDVLLLGDATLDYKDNRQTGTRNYVPSQVIETEFWGEAPSDNWFVAVSGEDLLPDLLIGRLAAQTVDGGGGHGGQNPPVRADPTR